MKKNPEYMNELPPLPPWFDEKTGKLKDLRGQTIKFHQVPTGGNMKWYERQAVRQIEHLITASVLILGAVLAARGLIWLAGQVFLMGARK